ncbi:5-formyltetrahydrofolate cyclo-ligase [Clostridium tarantellae]|uniref:5-formyltetrahydrofolate cyclo-ligase n=1 Tax=Clostridium tarantellae TaxID=39493 RepID=A0A6I1MQB6_9CLOT|nr:5-formyltetrahydrofolate cyclo-ligase [Clostridium tarantellae]MPQ44678.1 5-formyltetrahydrofolate cyclo-ligase [Clostridium tarantellae]
MKKEDLRLYIKKKRNSLKSNDKKILDNKIKINFIESEYFKKSKVIFIYVNMDSEIDTLAIIKEALRVGKKVAVPKVLPGVREMKALEIKSLLDLNESGAFGILEPNINNIDLSNEIDLVILPGLAFDRDGNRVGYGGGFYDTFLDKHHIENRIALCYDFQVVEEIEIEDFDKVINGIITNKTIINIV